MKHMRMLRLDWISNETYKNVTTKLNIEWNVLECYDKIEYWIKHIRVQRLNWILNATYENVTTQLNIGWNI